MKDLEETVQKHIKALPTTFDDPAQPLGSDPKAVLSPYNPRPKAEQPSEILITVSSRYRTDLWFRIRRNAKLSVVFEAWKEKMAESVYEETVAAAPASTSSAKGKNKGKGKKKEVEKIKYEGLPKFVFTLYGKALKADMTPEQLDMRDKDEIAVFELLDLTEDLSVSCKSVIACADERRPFQRKPRRNWSSTGRPAQKSGFPLRRWRHHCYFLTGHSALDSLEEILEIV